MRIGITINFDKNFYSNGLQQNVVFLFNLLNEIENFNPFYLWEGQEINPKIIDKNKCIQYKYFLTDSSFKFDLIIMMGFTFGDKVITKIKEKNKEAKVVLLQCGNQYIENMTLSLFDSKTNFSPLERQNKIDQIWVLPHYQKNISYMKTFFKTDNVITVPYIWDNFFIDLQNKNNSDTNTKRNFYSLRNKSISILEPNLNNSKNCILPLFITDSYEQKFPNVLQSCNVFCGKQLANNEYFIKMILQMDIYNKRKDFLKLHNRLSFLEIIKKHGSIIISHQQDNALNYLYLESLYLDLPLLHNSTFIKEYGYYYPENEIEIARDKLDFILKNHASNIESYSTNNKKILNQYSLKNKVNQDNYLKIIKLLFKDKKKS
tara:strand:- start:65 stop:1189 length:1125 start_codon:yes stop_codon:yes gene_type:complete